MDMCAKTGRKLRTLCVLLLSSTVLAALLTAFFPQLSLVSFACCAVFLMMLCREQGGRVVMMLCREQSGRVVMMLFALLIVPLPSVMSSGDGSAALAVSSVLFSAAAGALRSVLFGDFPYHLPDLGDESVYENRFVRREIRHDSLSPDIKSTGRSVMLNIGVSREGMEKGLIKKTAAEK